MIDYYSYIHSEAWFQRTEQVRKRNGGTCEVCNLRFGAVVHHRTYQHLGEELDEELLHVCKSCHEAIHGLTTRKFFIWPSRLDFLCLLQHEAIRMNLYGRTD